MLVVSFGLVFETHRKDIAYRSQTLWWAVFTGSAKALGFLFIPMMLQ